MPAVISRIPNPDKGKELVERVQANIDSEIFHYFFRKVLAGDHGARAAMISTFFHKYYAAAVAAGIAAEWSPDNEAKLAAILANLNFNPTATPSQPKKQNARKQPATTRRTAKSK